MTISSTGNCHRLAVPTCDPVPESGVSCFFDVKEIHFEDGLRMLKGELDPRKLAASRVAIINVVIRAVLRGYHRQMNLHSAS